MSLLPWAELDRDDRGRKEVVYRLYQMVQTALSWGTDSVRFFDRSVHREQPPTHALRMSRLRTLKKHIARARTNYAALTWLDFGYEYPDFERALERLEGQYTALSATVAAEREIVKALKRRVPT